ncbi:MAG: hypothetical protein Q9190_007063 [Brigantiaea leucoxantha]
MAASNSDAEMEYLSPSFDPSSLTVPRLRSILLSHDISYPASAKKPQLVQIFSHELVPRSKKILAARSRIRRTSKGITDMPSSQEGTVDGDEDGASSMPPPAIPEAHGRTPRKNTRHPSEESLHKPLASKSGRRRSSKHPRPSDTETEPDQETQRPSARKTRKSDARSKVKLENGNEKLLRPSLEKSPFSDENPFQSGSSPLAPGENRRRSAGVSVDRRKSTSRRRKTEHVGDEGRSKMQQQQQQQQDGVIVPTSKTFEIPFSKWKGSQQKVKSEDEVPAGEEFTPEEQLDLAKERAVNGQVDVVPPRRKRRAQDSNQAIKLAPWTVCLAILSGFAYWYRREKIQIGYCGIGRASDAIGNVQIPEWASVIQPVCEPCPPHALCYENLETQCEQDFILKPHPLSIAGLVPLPPTCEPDGEKARRVKHVADRAVAQLRERKAQSECGTLVDEQGKAVKTPEIDELKLKQQVAKQKRRGMGDAEFEDLWRGALGEIMGKDEIVSSTDTSNLASTVSPSATSLQAPPSPASPSHAPSDAPSSSPHLRNPPYPQPHPHISQRYRPCPLPGLINSRSPSHTSCALHKGGRVRELDQRRAAEG